MIFKFFTSKMNSFKYILFLMLFVVSTAAVNADESSFIDDKPTLFHIVDKYNEVKLSLAKSSIFMQVNVSVKNYTNQKIEQRHHIDASRFIDSQGHFLLGELVLLNSEKLEYKLDDIEVSFDDGKLLFEYHRSNSITFEEILSTDGTPVLENFSSSDLEQFYINYKKLAEFSRPITKD